MHKTKKTGETLILGCYYFLRRGYLEVDNHLLFKSKPAPIGTIHLWQDGKQHRKTADGWIEVAESEVQNGTFNEEIQALYDKRKFALIKQKLFGENQLTNKELAQMAGAHKNELVRITNDDYGIIVKIMHRDYTARRIIQKDENQNLFIHNFKIWKFNENLTSLGAATIRSQILTGSKYKDSNYF